MKSKNPVCERRMVKVEELGGPKALFYALPPLALRPLRISK
jgi:hypothetical protein